MSNNVVRSSDFCDSGDELLASVVACTSVITSLIRWPTKVFIPETESGCGSVRFRPPFRRSGVWLSARLMI
jgi:hypothetical protein